MSCEKRGFSGHSLSNRLWLAWLLWAATVLLALPAQAKLLKVSPGATLVADGPATPGVWMADASGHRFLSSPLKKYALRCEGAGVVDEPHVAMPPIPFAATLWTARGLSRDGQDALFAVRLDAKLWLYRARCGTATDTVIEADLAGLAPLPIWGHAITPATPGPHRVWENNAGDLCLGEIGGIRCFGAPGRVAGGSRYCRARCRRRRPIRST